MEKLPAEYLVWLSRLDDLREPLRSSVVFELGRRVLEPTTAVIAPKLPAPEIHIGEVDQDGEELPF